MALHIYKDLLCSARYQTPNTSDYISSRMEPHVMLKVSANASEKEINDAFKVLERKWRPDSNLRYVDEATEMMREINAARRTMLRRAAQAKATARVGESSSSPARHNPASSSEGPGSASNQASSSHTSRVNKASGDGSDRIPSSSHIPNANKSSGDGSDRNPPKPPHPIRKQSKDSDHRPQRTSSSFIPEPFRRSSSSTNSPPISPDVDLTNEYNNSFFNGRISTTWVHPIKFTLEDLFHGKKFKVHLERHQLVGRRRPTVLIVDIPAGCATGSEIMFENAGHENRDGRRQDILVIIGEAKHRDFIRIQDDLSIDVELPWDDGLTEGKQSMRLEGLDGQDVMFTIDPRRNRATAGTVVVPAAGMPICGDPGRRGNLIIHWSISKTGSRWLRKVFRDEN